MLKHGFSSKFGMKLNFWPLGSADLKFWKVFFGIISTKESTIFHQNK